MGIKLWSGDDRRAGLQRFAVAITAFNILGHTVFGFEQSWAQPVVAVLTAYAMELLLELVDARATQRTPRFVGGPGTLVDFLLSAHITGLAVAMLLYANDRLWPVAFAAGVAIGSKAIFRARVGKGRRHFFNPSNLGISVTLILFPWVGIAPPYHFTENLVGWGDWIVPAFIIVSGSLLNARFTHRLPLIATWVGAFALQAWLRSAVFGTPVVAGLVPMTGVAFLLFTFYMITDPATTPARPPAQVMFAAAVAAVYALLMTVHIVFGLFFALSLVCAVRGMALWALEWAEQRARRPVRIAAPAPALTATPALMQSRADIALGEVEG